MCFDCSGSSVASCHDVLFGHSDGWAVPDAFSAGDEDAAGLISLHIIQVCLSPGHIVLLLHDDTRRPVAGRSDANRIGEVNCLRHIRRRRIGWKDHVAISVRPET